MAKRTAVAAEFPEPENEPQEELEVAYEGEAEEAPIVEARLNADFSEQPANPYDEGEIDPDQPVIVPGAPGQPVSNPDVDATNFDASHDALVHDDQGNVRAIFSAEGVGEVTRVDAEEVLTKIREQGRYTVKPRDAGDERVYDVFRGKELIIAGAYAEDLNKLLL